MFKPLLLSLILGATAWAGTILEIKTSQGLIEVELYDKAAPLASHNFKELSKSGYYDKTMFHRVIKNFMIQAGDPTATGRGGESVWKKNFKDEFKSGYTFGEAGVLAMANAGPNTNGSQFFITTVPTPWLNNKHTIFGHVTKGMNIVHKIEKVKTLGGGNPFVKQEIYSIRIKK